MLRVTDLACWVPVCSEVSVGRGALLCSLLFSEVMKTLHLALSHSHTSVTPLPSESLSISSSVRLSLYLSLCPSGV